MVRESPGDNAGVFSFMEPISAETSSFYGISEKSRHLSTILPQFLDYARYDQRLAPETLVKYRDSVNRFIRAVGDGSVGDLSLQHFSELKRKMFDEGAKEARVASVIFAMKSLLRYVRDVHNVHMFDLSLIRAPRKPRRDVIYLTNEEVQQFLAAIPLKPTAGLRFRTLCEVLLGSAMRISEALSLDREKIDFFRKEAKVIGKGNKERIAFFSERSLKWIKRYLSNRHDNHSALFITNGESRRLRRQDISRFFKHYASLSGLNKKVTPHILRHTAATNLLFNGCPISHVKEILGHDRLETTCKYYLGLDRKEAKAAHEKFLQF